jgi:ABC-type transporter Mla MlaB component
MLKISMEDEPHQVTLKLEGSLAGIWVMDLEESWRALYPARAGGLLRVHLFRVEHVDNAGRYLLALIRHCGAQLTAEGIVMSSFGR